MESPRPSSRAYRGGQVAFLSAGGYHHHLDANTWQSAGAGQPPEGSAALRHATVVLPSKAEHKRLAAQVADAGHELEALYDGVLVRDPAGNPIMLAQPPA